MTRYNADLDSDVQGEPTQLLLATVGEYDGVSGSTLIFDGTDTPSTKRYKRATSFTLASGNRVLVAKISGTYVILGKIQ